MGEPPEWQLVWRDRSGKKLGLIGQPQPFMACPALSGDARRVAVAGMEAEDLPTVPVGVRNDDIWIHDVNRPLKTRLTFQEGQDRGPVWSPTDKEIAFASGRGGNLDIYLLSADGGGEPKAILATEVEEFPTDWSSDGKHILYDRHDRVTGPDIWCLERNGTGFQPAPFLVTKFGERAAKFSPDGRYVAYVSDESGSDEVYVRQFPPNGGKWRVSENGGRQPRWRGDGTELYFGEGDTLLAVPVKLGHTFSMGVPVPLFQSEGLAHPDSRLPRYDVTADGQRFVVREPLGERSQAIRVVQNWDAEFWNREGTTR